MERARHRLKCSTRNLKKVCGGDEGVKFRDNNNKCRNMENRFTILGVVLITVICLFNQSIVQSAEVGVVDNNSGSGVIKRGILHRDSTEKASESESSSLKNKNHCQDKECGSGNGTDDDEESHKAQFILRDIFSDEDGEESFEEDFEVINDDQQDDFEVLRDGNYDKPISRHARSEPKTESPLFPEGRGQRGGKGTRGTPRESGNKKRNNNASGVNKGRNKNKKKSGEKGSDLTKYNEYMDAVFNRMNAMIKKKRMDPLRVNLFAGPNKANQKKQGGGGNKGKKQKNSGSARSDLEEEDEGEVDVEDDGRGPARKDIYLNLGHGHEVEIEEEEEELDERDDDEESVRKIRALLENLGNSTVSFSDPDEDNSEGPRGNDSKPKKPKGSSNKDKGQKNANKKNKNTNDSKNKDKNNKNSKKTNAKPTRGILHGLSSLKREGNVAVIRQGDKVRVVRANFILGPVSLEILPKKSKADEGEKKEVAATATAPKLKGILEVRLKKGSPTKIRKLRVYPPKSVKVAGENGVESSSGKKKKPQNYRKVTPMATARLRQIASTVVRQTDKTFKTRLNT